MEAVSGGASALAFIGIALKSTEAIYKTISGIKDAPDKVERLLSAVDDLRSILKQLSGLFAPPVAAQTFNDFDAAIQKCNEDLASLAKKLSLLHKMAGDGKWKSTWKRIRAVLKKEDIQDMWTTVHHHVTVLGVYVGVLQSFSATRQTQSIVALEQAFQTNANHVSSNTQTLEAQASLISSLDGRFRLHESHSSAAQQTAEQALGVLGQKIDAMPSLSENQFEVIKSMLDQLSIQQMERTVVEQCGTSSQSSSTAPGSYQTMAAQSFDILSSITRLCGLVDAKEKTVGSSEAVGIIEDLEVLLNTVQDSPSSIAGEKRKRDGGTAGERSDIKRAKGILTSAYHVKVNNEKRILRARDPTRSVDKRTSKAVTTEDGTLLLRTRTRFENDASMDEKILEFAANLTFMSSRPEIRMKISACFYQRMLSEGSYLVVPPMLSVHVIVPDDSDIFKLIKNDNLRGVVELLEQGRASLRDCDTKGRSLLSYASYAKSADICRFLVERGADVDALEALISDAYGEDWESFNVPPLMQSAWSTCSDRSSHDCKRILVDAGADPQLQVKGSGKFYRVTPLIYLLETNAGNLLPLLDLSHEFVDVEQRDHLGQRALLRFVSQRCTPYSPNFIADLRVEERCSVNFYPFGHSDRSLRPKLWREVLESTGHDPSQQKVLLDAFPDLRRKVDTSTTYLDEPVESNSNNIPDYVYTDSGDALCFDEYSSDDAETSLDPDPSSSAEARTSEPPSPTPAARVQAPAGTFWDVIDHAVEEEGNPWA